MFGDLRAFRGLRAQLEGLGLFTHHLPRCIPEFGKTRHPNSGPEKGRSAFKGHNPEGPYTLPMELGTKKPSLFWFWGPNSIMVVYVGPSGQHLDHLWVT